MQSRTQSLSVFSLIMITVVSVDSIRNLPVAALFGSQLIFFFALGSLLFLLPCAFISAELSAAWPKQGGVYIWVKEAFGPRWGLFAIWLQWIENVIWYPTLLSFAAGTLGYLIYPPLAQQSWFLITVILIAFWSTTIINLKGLQTSAKFSTFCTCSGLLMPMALIIYLGSLWFIQDRPMQITFNLASMIPSFQEPHLWVSLTAIILSFCGMEIATVHAKDVKNPQQAFPRALLAASLIIVITLLLGSLALALVIPQQEMSLVAGIMQACDIFLQAYHLTYLLPFVGTAVIIGSLGSINNWIIAPAKGLLVAAEDGLLPRHLSHTNRQGAPQALLFYQAIIVSLLCSIYLFMPAINGAYWFLTALAVQLYMLMYIIMFIAAIYLRYKHPQQTRPFRIPGNHHLGMWFTAGCGLIGSSIAFIVSYIPPSHIPIGPHSQYKYMLIFGFLMMLSPPILVGLLHNKTTKLCTSSSPSML